MRTEITSKIMATINAQYVIIPSTQATAPSPATIAKINTHNTVGTARTNEFAAIITVASHAGAKFLALKIAKKNDTIALSLKMLVPL